MRNPYKMKVLIVVVALLVTGLFYIWPYAKMELAGSAHYTEQDVREYGIYTPEILKKIPRISKKYNFDFANIDGSASQAHAVTFYGTKDTKELNEYLERNGYKRQGSCNIDDECWRGTDPNETIMVNLLNSETGVSVQVIYNYR